MGLKTRGWRGLGPNDDVIFLCEEKQKMNNNNNSENKITIREKRSLIYCIWFNGFFFSLFKRIIYLCIISCFLRLFRSMSNFLLLLHFIVSYV
jgi:hypothetical protein